MAANPKSNEKAELRLTRSREICLLRPYHAFSSQPSAQLERSIVKLYLSVLRRCSQCAHSFSMVVTFSFHGVTEKQIVICCSEEELLKCSYGNKQPANEGNQLSISRFDKFIPWMGCCRFLREPKELSCLKAFSACPT